MTTYLLITKEGCGACQEAKELLTSNDNTFTEKKIGVDITQDEVLRLYPGVRVVPVVVKDGDWIGSTPELKQRLLTE
jgi:glutaredoxin